VTLIAKVALLPYSDFQAIIETLILKEIRVKLFLCNYSVPLFEKEGLGEILLDKSPSPPPLFSKGESKARGLNTYTAFVQPGLCFFPRCGTFFWAGFTSAL